MNPSQIWIQTSRQPGPVETCMAELGAALTHLMQENNRQDVEVLFSSGVHLLRETLELGPEQIPARGYHLRLRSQHPDTPAVLRASIPLTGWEGVKGTPCLKAPLPDAVGTPRSLYAEGIRMPNARSRVFLPQTLEGKDPLRYCRVPAELMQGAPAQNLTLSLLPKQKWIHNRIPIASADLDEGSVFLSAPATYPLAPIGYGWFPEGHAWIENHPRDLTEPGQWVMDYVERTVTWWPLAGQGPDTSVRVPVCTEMIRVEGRVDREGPVDACVQGVSLQGLSFTENDVYLWPEDHTGLGIQHDWELWDAPSAALRFRGADDCTVEDCTFSQLASTAIRMDLSCKRHRIVGNRIEHVGGVGILASGYGPGTKDTNRHHLIEGNEISYVGESLWHGVGIFIWQSGHNVVRRNRISHCPYTGIVIAGRITYKRNGRGQCSGTIRWDEIEVEEGAEKNWMTWYARERYQHARENLIEGNEITRVMEMIGDGNAIYLSGAGGGNRLVGNYLHDNDSLCMNAVIRSDDDQHETVIEENLILRSVGEGILIKGRSDLRGNILVDLRAADSNGQITDYLRGYLVVNGGSSMGSVIMSNQCYATQDLSPFLNFGGRGSHGPVNEDNVHLADNRFEALSDDIFQRLNSDVPRFDLSEESPVTQHEPFWPRIRIKEHASWIREDE